MLHHICIVFILYAACTINHRALRTEFRISGTWNKDSIVFWGQSHESFTILNTRELFKTRKNSCRQVLLCGVFLSRGIKYPFWQQHVHRYLGSQHHLHGHACTQSYPLQIRTLRTDDNSRTEKCLDVVCRHTSHTQTTASAGVRAYM